MYCCFSLPLLNCVICSYSPSNEKKERYVWFVNGRNHLIIKIHPDSRRHHCLVIVQACTQEQSPLVALEKRSFWKDGLLREERRGEDRREERGFWEEMRRDEKLLRFFGRGISFGRINLLTSKGRKMPSNWAFRPFIKSLTWPPI